jgi:hypothetical protein
MLEKINIIDDSKINKINKSIIDTKKSKIVDYIFKLSNSQDFQLMLNLLISLQENSQYIKRENEFETLYAAAGIDGQRRLTQDFVELCTRAMEGDVSYVQNKIDPIIIK